VTDLIISTTCLLKNNDTIRIKVEATGVLCMKCATLLSLRTGWWSQYFAEIFQFVNVMNWWLMKRFNNLQRRH